MLELTLIRWLAGQVRVLAYYPNLILLSAFLGLGLGSLRASGRSWLPAWPPLLLVTIATALELGRVVFTHEGASEHLFLLYYDLPRDAPVVSDVRLPILLFFLLSCLCFVPLGQFVAQRLQEFRRREAALRGYAFDLAGSLAGVVAFAIAGFLGSFPVAWFALALAAGFALTLGRSGVERAGYLACAAAALGLVSFAERADSYSPYYAIRSRPRPDVSGFEVLTNGSLHQIAAPLGGTAPAGAWVAQVREGYHLPYRLLKRPPRRALVVGAGTGNDVAVLLAEGAEQVDAVEIDPAILALGAGHPDRPYASPRVRAINADARSFLNETRESYDLVVFGTLDSMTRLSALSNVRLDNFVYTLDCLRAARARLSPDGGIVLYFMAGTDYIDARLNGLVARAFDEIPLVSRAYYRLFNRIYMAGPAFAHVRGEERRRVAQEQRELLARVERLELPTDDWPFLYLARRGVSSFYWTLAAVFGALAVLGVLGSSPALRRSLGGGADWPMFLFGLAFLLLETRAVTEMNLLWGSTWITSAVVFGSILTTILLATLAAERRPAAPETAQAGLVASLLLVYLVPASSLLGTSGGTRLVASALFVGAPIFFAGLCFAALFRERPAADLAFGWNLLGAVAGGLLELAGMAIGLKALLLVALVAYLAAILLWRREGVRASAS